MRQMQLGSHVPCYGDDVCRSCAEGGRRCPRDAATRTAERKASSRYYQRGRARKKIAELADAGIPAIGDEDMPTTYHKYGEGRAPDLGNPHRLYNQEGGVSDKPGGALWASPGRVSDDGSVKTGWTDWAARELYGGFSESDGGMVEVKPTPGAVVVCVNEPEDWENLVARYPRDSDDPDTAPELDWTAARADGIDGVYVDRKMATIGSRYETHGPNAHPVSRLYGWDVAQVGWLSTEKIEVGESVTPGTYRHETPEDDEDDNPNVWNDLVREDDFDTYVEPERPDMDKAWGRVPKRFQPTTATATTPAAAPVGVRAPSTLNPDGQGVSSNMYEYTTNPTGGAVPQDKDWLDLASEALRAAGTVRKKSRKR